MRSKLEKTIALTLAAGMISGCVGNAYNTAALNWQKDEILFEQKRIAQNLDISEFNSEDLKTNVYSFSDYLKFREKYQSSIKHMLQNVEKARDIGSSNLWPLSVNIQDLAKQLESDTNPYARKYLQKLKEFNYSVFRATDIVTYREGRRPDSSVAAALCVGLVFPMAFLMDMIVDYPRELGIYQGDMVTYSAYDRCFPKYKDKELEKTTFNKVRITPYNEKEDILEKDIPYEKVKEELGGNHKKMMMKNE